MKGRKRLPTEWKVLTGNPGGRPLPKEEPKPGVLLPRAPRHLSPIARAFWNRVGARLVKIRVMTEADAETLELAAVAWSNYRKAQAVLDKKGFTCECPLIGKKGEVIGYVIRSRPEVVIAKNSWRQALQALVEFGLSPSSRSRVHVSGTPAPKDEKAAIQQGALR